MSIQHVVWTVRVWSKYPYEPSHEIMVLFVLRILFLQTRMVGPFICFHTSSVRTAKVMERLCGCVGSPKPLLVAYVISTIIS